MAKKKVVVKKTPVKKAAKKVKPILEKVPEPVVPAVVVPEVVEAAPVKNIGAELNNSGAPKNLMIKCSKCCWARMSSGLTADLTDIHEIKSACKTCGKWRRFHCPKCGAPSTMKRLKGNV